MNNVPRKVTRRYFAIAQNETFRNMYKDFVWAPWWPQFEKAIWSSHDWTVDMHAAFTAISVYIHLIKGVDDAYFVWYLERLDP